MKLATNDLITAAAKRARERIEEIKNTKSEYPENAKKYYVDAVSGSDKNDGLTPETAWRTLDRAGSVSLPAGSVVLFRRGQVFHGIMRVYSGVTYSAYGEGAKPELLGSIDASSPEDWLPTDYPNVWRYRHFLPYTKDIGGIFFGDGSVYGIKVTENFTTGERGDMGPVSEMTVFNGRREFKIKREPWCKNAGGLKNDLEFYQSPHEDYLYLFCADGNPAEVFGRVELSQRCAVALASRKDICSVTFDNLTFKYCNFGISLWGNCNDLTVRNCTFENIGGAATTMEAFKLKTDKNDVKRYGNGIEIYGWGENMVVENCYFDQIYDAAVTMQYSTSAQGGRLKGDLLFNGLKWNNNVFNRSHYCFELWLSTPGGRETYDGYTAAVKDLEMNDNLCFNTGLGWAHHRIDRWDTFLYTGWVSSSFCDFINCECTRNTFVAGHHPVFRGRSLNMEKGIKFFGNEIYHGGIIAHTGENMIFAEGEYKMFPNSDETLRQLTESGTWGNNSFYKIMPEYPDYKPFVEI